jgi:hypothetical protein
MHENGNKSRPTNCKKLKTTTKRCTWNIKLLFILMAKHLCFLNPLKFFYVSFELKKTFLKAAEFDQEIHENCQDESR